MENENDLLVEETTEVEETETNDVQEEVKEEQKPEKKPLTLEQKRGILKRQLTKVEKELGITSEEKPRPQEKETPKKRYSLEEIDEITALSGIPKEDRPEVIDYAERKGIKPSEALNTPFIKTFLRTQAEERATALASNTGTGKRGAAQASDEQILSDAEAGKEVDPIKLAEAKTNARRKQLKQ